jgi:prophage regulatory protein
MSHDSKSFSILRLKEAITKTGVGRSTIYAMMNKNCFPKPVKLGPKMVGWIESEIDTWLLQQIQKTRGEAK